MGEQPGLVDGSFDNVVPAQLPASVRVSADYLSHDPSKDWTPAQIKATHAAGRGCLFLWETNAGRALTGSVGGPPDARDSAAELDGLIAGVGYRPKNKLGICAAVDQDITGEMKTVVAYFEAFHAGLTGRYLLGDYGEADVIDALAAICEFGFQASAWSHGVISPNADAWQFLNGQKLAGGTVDFDRLIHPERMGIWWPPGHSLDVASATQITNGGTPTEDDMTTLPEVTAALADLRSALRADMIEQVRKLEGEIAVKVWGQPIQDSGKTMNPVGASAWLADALVTVKAVNSKLGDLPAAVVAALPAGQASYTLEQIETAVASAITANPVHVTGTITGSVQ